MNLEELLEKLNNKYPSSVHQGIPVLRIHPDGSGTIFHEEMEAFGFSSLKELFEHLSEEIK